MKLYYHFKTELKLAAVALIIQLTITVAIDKILSTGDLFHR